MPDGSLKTAKQIFEEVTSDGELFLDNDEQTIYVPNKKLSMFSLNKNSGKLELKEVKHVWRLLGGRTIKATLRNGFSITTTPEHKYVVSRDREFVDVMAGELKLGDRIVCARRLAVNSHSNIKERIISKLAEENFYVHLNKEFQEEFSGRIKSFGIKKLHSMINLSMKRGSLVSSIINNRYNLSDVLKISEFFSYDFKEIYDSIDRIFYRNGKQRGQNSLKIKLPQNFEEFFYLSGLFLGDGSGKKFIVGKEQLSKELIRICNSLGFIPKRVDRADRTPELHTNLTLKFMLKCLFDYPSRKKSHNIRISEFVHKSDNKYVSKLLSGYFDTDGCVEKSRSAVTITSASSKMLDDLQLLLLRFGCVSIKEIDNTLAISGLSAINFENEIGFCLDEKFQKLRVLVSKASGSIVCDTMKVGNQVMIINKRLGDITSEELAFIEVKKLESGFEEVVYDFTIPETHNFIAEGMIIHNTALTDNLLAAAGQMSAKNAGDLDEGMATWQHADEQERLMTVDSANVSMVHDFDDKEYLINLIDTPGHVDFSGNVTRAMRAIDGTVVLVCASEGIMPQTETVLKQALRERVKPILFINKVDRLIKELKLTPEAMQARFIKIYEHFNELVEKIADPEFKEKWKVSITDGSVAFGSARDNWAMSLPFMKKKGVSFKDILNIYNLDEEERTKWVWEKAPAHEVLLDMVVKHLPNPLEAQKYRIPKIWHGDLDSDMGKDLMSCNPKGKPAFVVTRIVIDPRSGKEVCAGRLFSGRLELGQEVYLNLAKSKHRIQQILIYNGIKPEQLESIECGNVLAISGINAEAGETVTLSEEQPFEELKPIFSPVITKAIEVTRSADLPKLIEVLRKVGKEDPSIHIQINEETGENLISGMGELHLEIIENRIKTEKGLEVKTSSPIVVYRETVTKESHLAEGKSPNKHNLFMIRVEPLEDEIFNAIQDGRLPESRIKKKDKAVIEELAKLMGSNDEAKQVRDIYKGNLFMETTRGEVHLGEVIELVMDAFEQVMDAGPLAREPCMKIKVSLEDVKLHEDAIHRGPAQVYPAVRDGLYDAMKGAVQRMLEPVQVHVIEAPLDKMAAVTKLVSTKRGQILDVTQDEYGVEVEGKIPVGEMLGWSSDLRSATEGRGVSSLKDQMFEVMPVELQANVIRRIRDRKGLAENQ
ncbi:elongation factor EF-2 [Candidatus Pacearchaeota archaeon CG10_big_fil_rev_8_21_14_0_10_35_13]|nr:MAG: elongation factor EF-2 [Candidatus Pacearchaeota archaeon CG10_big_fil_rev_8_21_14_0_10_35_13]